MKVAILVGCVGKVGVLAENPSRSEVCSTNYPVFGYVAGVIARGIDFYVEEMKRQQPMPLSDGTSVSWEYTYINVHDISVGVPGAVLMWGDRHAGFAVNITKTTQYGGESRAHMQPFCALARLFCAFDSMLTL
ncbi:MAG: hypothetical protein Q7T57_09310 [Dehalococcoidales bacterium]|nr:hypothetical protein [Dehalococcoidales bacterium]